MNNKLPEISNIPLGNTSLPANNVYLTIFAGRRRYLECLKIHLDKLLLENIITEVHLWDYVRDQSDSVYIQELSRENSKYIYMKPTKKLPDWNEYYEYYSNANYNDEDILIKCDDDIVFIDTNQMCKYLNEIKQGGIYYPNIINNGVCAYIQSKYNIHNFICDDDIYKNYGKDTVPLETWGEHGWYKRFDRAQIIHEEFIKNKEKFIINAPTFPWKGRISINMFGCRFASMKKYFKLFLQHGNSDDEAYFSYNISNNINVSNYIVPFMNVSHFSFGPQNSSKLDALFLASYKKLAINIYNNIYRENTMLSIIQSIPDVKTYPLTYVFEHIKLQHKPNTLWLEFGVASGKTINYISKFTNGTVFGFDSFEGLPEKWRDGYDKGAFNRNGNFPVVNNNVKLIKGWFDNTLPNFILNQNKKVSFLHIDCDLYSSTKFILNTLKGHLDTECTIVFDELVNYPGFDGEKGELKAFYEFITENKVNYTWIGMNGKPVGMSGYYHENVALIIHSIN